MRTAADIIRENNREMVCIDHAATVADAVRQMVAQKIGAILAIVNQAGFRITNLELRQLDRALVEDFYGEHRERPFYNDLVRYMTSGPVVVQVLEGEDAINRHREIMGATNPDDAAPGTGIPGFEQGRV